MGEDVDVELEPTRHMRKGDQVEIIGGRLTGLKGTLVNLDGKKHFVLELENLGYAMRMEVDPQYLRKIRNGKTDLVEEPGDKYWN